MGTAALERIASDAWPAAHRDRLGDWQLRATAGWTGRANSALPVGDPGLPLPEAVDAVVDWYTERGLPARINVPLPLAAALEAELDARGWARSEPTLVQTAPLGGFDTSGAEDVLLSSTPTTQWLALVASRKGALPPEAHDLLTGPSLVRFATGYRDGTVTGTARGAVVSAVLHLGLVEVAEPARRQGLAGRLTRALADWARDAGAHTVLLQVEESNAPARALYARLGFRTHHSYVTRTRPAHRGSSA
jgi:GNAT superfamily N-acetyltransferase